MIRLTRIACILFLLLLASPLLLADPTFAGPTAPGGNKGQNKEQNTREHLHSFQDWQVWLEKGTPRLCILSSRPAKSEGKYTRRGDIHLLISRIPKQGREGEVSFVAGYPYSTDAIPRLVIDGTSFSLLTSGERAWSQDAKADRKIVQAMRKGLIAIVYGVSSRGTKTTDRFSLRGFGKAWKSAQKNCPMKKK